MHLIPVNPMPLHAGGYEREHIRGGFNQGFNNLRMGSACLYSQYLGNNDFFLVAQQGRCCGGPVGSCADGT